MLLAQGGEALLLGDGVDVGADDERHEVEERHPRALGQELLGESQADGRRDPAHTHHLPETGTHRRLDLAERPGARNDGHGDKVDRVLNGRDLGQSCQFRKI